MKKSLLPFLAVIIFCSCNSNSGDKTTNAENPGTPAEKKIERLEPSAIDLSKPIDAVQANYQINCWDDKKIEVAGYGFVFYGDSLDTKMDLELTDSAGGQKKLVECIFIKPPSLLKIAKTDMIHIRGNISVNFRDEIRIDSCEIIAVAKSIPTQAVNPFGKPVMSATELWTDYFKWEGKEIAVIGDYYMTTISTTAYGKTIRIDLKNPANYAKVIGCEFKEDPTAKIHVNEKGVIIKGKIKTYTPFGTLSMADCSVVNR